MLAARMGAGEIAIVAQGVEQSLARIHGDAARLPVDVEFERVLRHCIACSSARRVTARATSRR